MKPDWDEWMERLIKSDILPRKNGKISLTAELVIALEEAEWANRVNRKLDKLKRDTAATCERLRKEATGDGGFGN